MDHYDVIVVGAGSERRRRCGASVRKCCAKSLAARGRSGLSSRGDDTSAVHVQRRAPLARRRGIPEFDWDFTNTDGAGTLGGRGLRVPRGRLVGGTSMINATIAARGAPFDFDRWAAKGNKGWAWADLLPLFIAIENDVNFGGDPIHGREGPNRHPALPAGEWAPVNRAMYDACLELGVREAPDLNALDAHAGVVGPMPHNRYRKSGWARW